MSHSSSVYYGVSVTAFILLLLLLFVESLSFVLYAPVCVCASSPPAQAGSGSPIMATAIQEFQRTESDRLNEVKGHLEIALLEKHFLREYHDRHGERSEFTRWKLSAPVTVVVAVHPDYFFKPLGRVSQFHSTSFSNSPDVQLCFLFFVRGLAFFFSFWLQTRCSAAAPVSHTLIFEQSRQTALRSVVDVVPPDPQEVVHSHQRRPS